MRNWILAAAAAACAVVSTQAEAKRYAEPGVTQFCGDRVCGFSLPHWQATRKFHVKPRKARNHRYVSRSVHRHRSAAKSKVYNVRGVHRGASVHVPLPRPFPAQAEEQPVVVAAIERAVAPVRALLDGLAGEVMASGRARMLPHPDGCPRTRFCGCGVSLHVFGQLRRDLYLAANWLKFPRAEPAPGMVAARRGHVFAILRVVGKGKVVAFDPNSGRHRTRVHVRSLRGFVVVNPRGGSRYAGA
jgi:hypothetical protein